MTSNRIIGAVTPVNPAASRPIIEVDGIMAKLVAIEGPTRGTVFALDKPEVFIGRSSANDVAIADVSLSRRHSSIRLEHGAYTLRDLESNNGTFVNDIPVTERALTHGDRITIGDSALLFLATEDEETQRLIDSSISVGQTIQMSREESFYVDPEKFAESGAPTARLVRDLHALLKIGRSITNARSVEGLARQLLELVLEAVTAERGAILFSEEEGAGRTPTVYSWDRRSGADARVPMSSTVVDRVLKEGMAISSNDTHFTATLGSAESLRASGVKSVLAVPILRDGRALGVIYLDSSQAEGGFDKGHLQLVTAISGVAALALENVRNLESLAEENLRLQTELGLEHNMVGESAALRETVRLIGRVAPTDATVLILGESGTGKELAARAIHQNSTRAQKPFLAVNCAVLTETLVESELFGYEKGAFTGAFNQKKGKFELADGGTLFLDEIGELPPMMQAKLLRVLQEHEFERVGGVRPVKVDVRLIAATNRHLATAVKNNLFRQDLFYRLNVVSLTMPPLRERREDIPLLAGYFVQKFNRKGSTRRVRGISSKAQVLLENYPWPGNIRELGNVIERAVVLGSGDLIVPEDLPEELLEVPAGVIPLDEYHAGVNEARRQIVLRALEKTKGNMTQAAHLLGIQPTYLHRLVRNLGMKARLKNGEEAGDRPVYPNRRVYPKG
ncbi:MAG TPA: sigma 54-interacting transcriptional regulator [Candidatus Solibacter sp.]|nr:sigma 54-interacting transcriptional regulator [Candidatus Solibacter sp.]